MTDAVWPLALLFPVAGLDLPLWLPPLVTFVIGALCVTAGVSGAFLLLPFQVSVLGFTTPAVTPTNFIYNVVGIPGGVARYWREGRLDMTLAGVLAAGFVPGSFLGMLLRIYFLTDIRRFKIFVAAVLLFLAGRLLQTLREERRAAPAGGAAPPPPAAGAWRVARVRCGWRRVVSRLGDQEYAYNPLAVGGVSLLIGTAGGAYGIGGGALMAPILISIFRLPVHATAGANLSGTLVASVAGVFFYAVIGPVLAGPGAAVRPDWLLGLLFGLGGLAGMYLGAGLQRRVPARTIKAILACLLAFVAARYVWEVLVRT